MRLKFAISHIVSIITSKTYIVLMLTNLTNSHYLLRANTRLGLENKSA